MNGNSRKTCFIQIHDFHRRIKSFQQTPRPEMAAVASPLPLPGRCEMIMLFSSVTKHHLWVSSMGTKLPTVGSNHLKSLHIMGGILSISPKHLANATGYGATRLMKLKGYSLLARDWAIPEITQKIASEVSRDLSVAAVSKTLSWLVCKRRGSRVPSKNSVRHLVWFKSLFHKSEANVTPL